MPEIVSAAVPVSVSVTLMPADVVVMFVLGKASVVVESETPETVPVPESVTVCGELLALSTILIAAR